MENYLHGRFVAVARTEWKTQKKGDYEYKDLEVKGKLSFNILHGTEKQDLDSVGYLELDLFPSSYPSGIQSITVPDYLATVSGHMLCVVYLKEKNERVFALYDMNEHTKAITLHGSFVMDNALPPTAIIAIKERVFLGFPGYVGYVDMLEPKLSLQMFHEWQEQTWGRKTNDTFLKTIDAFAYDSSSSSKTLLAIDDVTWPKYAFAYNLRAHPPKLIAKLNLPEMVSGPNEHCRFSDKFGDIFVVTTECCHQGGYGTGVVIGNVNNGPLHSILEIDPYKDSISTLPRELLAGESWSRFNSVALLNENVVLIGAGPRGIIAFTIDSIKDTRINLSNDPEDEAWMNFKKPTLIRSLKIGTTTQAISTIKQQPFAFVLSTEVEQNKSILSRVVWNNDASELEVVKSNQLDGVFDKLFVDLCLGGFSSSFYSEPIWINGPDSLVGQRLYHSFVQDSKGDIWFFGGEDSGYLPVDANVWKLEVANNFTWVNVTTTGPSPSARGGYVFWILDDIIYLFGGESNYYNPVYTDFYSFNTSSLEWTQIDEYIRDGMYGQLGGGSYATPPQRADPAQWVDKNTKTLWMFGGSTETSNLNDVWCYNTSGGTWTWMSGSNILNDQGNKGDVGQASKDYIPASIWFPQAVVDKDGNVWIYSGIGPVGSSSELWRFTPSTLEWTFMGGSTGSVAPVYGTTGQYSADNWPAPTYGGNLVYSGGDIITYYGGERAVNGSLNIALSQVWSYNITLGQWAFISGNQEFVEDAPVYGSLQVSSASNKVGSRMEFGVSGAISGHMWVHGGTQDSHGSLSITSMFVLPVNLCMTEWNPCNANADCAPNGLTVTCTCQSGYAGDGLGENGCAAVPLAQPQMQPQTQPQASQVPQGTKTPTSKTSESSTFEHVAVFAVTLIAFLVKF